MSVVSIRKTQGLPTMPDLMAEIEGLLNPFGGMANFIFPGAKVLVKPNVGSIVPKESAMVTHPDVVEAVVRLAQKAGAGEIWVAESSIIGFDTDEAFDKAGYRSMAAATGAVLIDLKKEGDTPVPVLQPLQLPEIRVFHRALAADVIINVPKLKTIVACPISAGMKNLKGLIPDREKKRCHHTNLNRAIVDIYQVVRPNLTIIDAITGSSLYLPIEHHLLLGGVDTVALDTVAAICAGVNPDTVEYLVLADQYGFGVMEPNDIHIVGENPYEVQKQYKKADTDIEAYKTLYPQVEVVAGSACSGCVNSVELMLKRGESMGWLAKWRDKLVITIGKDADTKEKAAEGKTVLCLGNCAFKEFQGNFVPGCPFIGIEAADWLKEHEPESVNL